MINSRNPRGKKTLEKENCPRVGNSNRDMTWTKQNQSSLPGSCPGH